MTTAATPIRRQYLEIKRRHTDAILLFRIGDFYEAFDDDARLLAKELDIMLTSKEMGRNLRVPLAGVPHHSLERHLATLISRGHRVAICEQLTAAPVKGGSAGRGLIERDVVRVVTPGTVLETGLLQSKVNNYIAAFVTDGKRRAGVAYADVTTGDFAATELDSNVAYAELQRIAPSELLVPKSFAEQASSLPGFITRRPDAAFETERARRVVQQHFGSRSLAPFGLSGRPLAVAAVASIIDYLSETQSNVAEQLTRLTSYNPEAFMVLDEQTARSLELFQSAGGAPSLLATLDETRTAMGGRMLRRWLRQPLLDRAEIVRRHEHVARFASHERERAELSAALENVHDLERLSGRARAGLATPHEILALRQSLEAVPRVASLLNRAGPEFASMLDSLPDCAGLCELITAAVNDELPVRGEQAGVIREGYSEELDSLRSLLRNGKTFLAEMEQRERARTGIRSLRVGYNKVFGYFIEVTKPNLHLVPDGYTRKQTLAATERFITLELKEYESLVLNAQTRITELESGIFRHVCAEVGKERERILAAAASLAYLDVVCSYASAAARWNYARPEVVDDGVLRVRDGRHPVLERLLGGKEFVANDIELGGGDAPEIALITGPNMSGKSTYLRQAALTVIMAQAGSFVPAASATVGLTDRVYTRIGLYDRIGSGESTFMTEMVETAHILHHATPRSLVLLDELGRGTSTYDGLAVARAVLEYLHNHPRLRPKTLFATHYHELTELFGTLPRLKNLHFEIEERGGELVFLYRVAPGVAEGSYGVYAAKLAGLPRPVVRRAEELLREYEGGVTNEDETAAGEALEHFDASAWGRGARLVEELLRTDLDSLSPVEALMKLFELRRTAEGEAGKATKALKTA
ncbi:MAG TPA: DNA mismatch repair protein MutS [Pyrinomonadaceae bacterium]|nr:DNA mismatch repair protein MutS [Pyrinomonadaceae bacterium]